MRKNVAQRFLAMFMSFIMLISMAAVNVTTAFAAEPDEAAVWTVTVSTDIQNGSVSLIKDGASISAKEADYGEGDVVTLKAEPEEGYVTESVTVTDADGAPVTAEETDGTYRFSMPAKNVTVKAAFSNGDAAVASADADTEEADEIVTAEEGSAKDTAVADDSSKATATSDDPDLDSEIELAGFIDWMATSYPSNGSCTVTYDQVFNVDGGILVDWLEANDGDAGDGESEYLSTHYMGDGSGSRFLSSMVTRHDSGYVNAPLASGGNGLNCNGFFYRAIYDAYKNSVGESHDVSSDSLPGDVGGFYAGRGIEINGSVANSCAEYGTNSMKNMITNRTVKYYNLGSTGSSNDMSTVINNLNALIKSGEVTNGALILSLPYSDGTDAHGNAADNHYGFYWNRDGDGSTQITTSSQVFWNSIHSINTASGTLGDGDQNCFLPICGKCYKCNWYVLPVSQSNGFVKIQKSSADTAVTDDNGCYNFKGITFKLTNTEDSSITYTIDINDTTGKSSAVEVKAGTYKVTEDMGTNTCYQKNSEIANVTVTAANTADNPAEIKVSDVPLTDPVSLILEKVDRETGKSVPQGGADLSGAVYKVEYFDNMKRDTSGTATRTWYFATSYCKVDKAYDIHYDKTCFADGYDSDELYYNKARKSNELPLGTYRFTEVEAPKGYAINNDIKNNPGLVYYDNGDITTSNFPIEGSPADDTVYRGDLELHKNIQNGKGKLAYTQFKITMLDKDGNDVESHVISTDGSGDYDTSTSYIKHSKNTNRLGVEAADGGYETTCGYSSEADEDKAATTGGAGIWFGEGSVNDDKGALPYGTYRIEELRCAGNKGYQLITTTITIKRDTQKVVLDLGDDLEPTMQTQAQSEDGTQYIPADEEVTFTDTVSYEDFESGTYQVKGTLMDKETGEALKDADGNEITVTETKKLSKSGTFTMEFTFDASLVAGKDIVVFEEASKDDFKTVYAYHKEIDDEDQTIHVVELQTKAVDKAIAATATADQPNLLSEGTVSVTDTVSYKNVPVGKELTVKGTLVDQSTGEAITVNGKELTAETKFTPETSEGTVDVVFNFESTDLSGKTLVAYEQMYLKKAMVGHHEDKDDEAQTLHKPGVKTNASDKLTGDEQGSIGEKTTIIDKVTYTNLNIGKEYTVTGTLMNKATGEELTVEGATASRTFTAEQTDGTIDLEFTIDTTALQGDAIVAFETVTYEGIEVAVHKDLTDKNQTVYEPKIGTTAADSKTGDNVGYAAKSVTINDTVHYVNLKAGTEYTLKGVLMDKSTKKALTVDGKEVTAETTFTTPDSEDGKPVSGDAVVSFTFDSSTLGAKSVVAYEDLYYTNGKLIASHKDLTDEGQTVTIPKIGTKATDNITKSQQASYGKTVKITDTVSYSGLIIGKEYTVKGTLMDKSTNKALSDAGATAEKTFTADKTDGTVELEFTIDTTSLQGKSVVAFERMYHKNIEVAVHADLKDKNQTVYVPKIGTKATINGAKEANAASSVTITDTVSYENLIAGQKYTMKGTLMDKSTGKALGIAGATATTEFTPKTSSGTMTMTFTIDASKLGGKSLVVYEKCLLGTNVIAAHEDITDADQTVTIKSTTTGKTTTTSSAGSVKTGDTSNIAGMIALFCAAAAALAAAVVIRRRKIRKI